MNLVLRLIVFSVLLAFLGCASDRHSSTARLSGYQLSKKLNKASKGRLEEPFVKAGIQALVDGDYVLANEKFNRALKFVPQNSQLHFLNGLSYNLQALRGDTTQEQFAEVGYNLSLQFDASNYWAAFLLGHLQFQKQQYRMAQDWFAYALLFEPEQPELLHALAAASYFAQDLKTAMDAISQAEKLNPENSSIMRDSVLINAAVSKFDDAESHFSRFKESIEGDHTDFRTDLIRQRLADWKKLHKQNPSMQLAQNSVSDILGSTQTKEGLSPGKLPKRSRKNDKKKKKKLVKKDMVLVDVAIIRSEEKRTTGKGVNLLNGLSVTLSGNLLAYSDAAVDSNTAPNTRTQTTTISSPTLATPTVTYSLNIFNDNDDRNEVLARPTLVGLDGEKSEFFSGAVLHVEIAGAAGSEGNVQMIPIGIKLEITPQFIDKDTVELNVQAARAFIEDRSPQPGFNFFLQTSKIFVTANVAMKFGQTLVLSGLSEKETENLKDGVPFLQNIPGIQYFFSREDTLDFTKSVVILLTPRKPHFTHGDGTDKIDPVEPPDMDITQPNLSELKNKKGWIKPAPNMDAVFYHLQNRRLYKEFRRGDVTLESWDNRNALMRMLVRSIDFLYY